MATSKADAAKATQLVESLWALMPGQDFTQAQQVLAAYKSGGINSYDEFKNQLRLRAIAPDTIKTAEKMAAWRPKKGASYKDSLMGYLKDVLGWEHSAVLAMFDKATNVSTTVNGVESKRRIATPTPEDYLKVLRPMIPGEMFTQTLIKTGASKSIAAFSDVPQWNPLRTDKPPFSADQPKPTDNLMAEGVAGAPAVVTPATPQGLPARDSGGEDLAAKTPAGTPLPKPVDTRPAWLREGRAPTPEEIDEHVRRNFGADAWFMDIPEVHKILTDMAREGNTDGVEATRRVTGTSWYKNTSDVARAFAGREKSEPESVRADIAEQTAFLEQVANEMDVDITPERLTALAEASLRFGWSPAQIKKTLGMEFKYDAKAEEQSSMVSGMKINAAKYLVPLSEAAIESWAKGMMTGERSEADFKAYLVSSAKSMFPQLQAALDAGHTVEDYVDPYKQLAAKYLERPPESINFMLPEWRAALEQRDPKTGQIGVMTLSEWTSKLKTDKTYGYDKTLQGVDEASKLANDLLKKFGKVA